MSGNAIFSDLSVLSWCLQLFTFTLDCLKRFSKRAILRWKVYTCTHACMHANSSVCVCFKIKRKMKNRSMRRVVECESARVNGNMMFSADTD